jgi:hypothetical protein
METQEQIKERILELIKRIDQRQQEILQTLDEIFSLGDNEEDNTK